MGTQISPAETENRSNFCFSMSVHIEIFLIILSMPLTRQQKDELVAKLAEQMKAAKSVIFADYLGLSVSEISDLRAKMREQGVQFTVAKKTLLRLAAKEAGFGEVSPEVMEGPVGAAFSMEDEVAAAKLIHTAAKKNENLKLRGGLFEGRILSVDEAKQLAQIPSKEELLAKFVYLVKSPIQGFHGVLNNTISGFVRVLDAVKEQKEKAA